MPREADPRKAAEASLAENVHREPMHPADEFEAFQRLVQDGASIEEVAERFGTSPLTVRRRMKLADVHPDLRQLYREGGIMLEQLMALALSDDPEQQLAIWNGAPTWNRDAYSLRSLLVAEEVDATTDALAKFIGIEAYEAAGGAVRRDLFSEAGEGYLQDSVLLGRLANEQLEIEAEGVRAEGWSWLEIVPRASSLELYKFGRAAKSQRKMTKAENKSREALAKQLSALEGQQDQADTDEDPEAFERLEQELEGVQDQIKALESSIASYGDEAKAVSGVIVCVGRDGKLEIHRGLIRPKDRKGARAAGGEDEHDDADDAADATESPTRAKPIHSAALMRELTAHRTLAARAALLDRPDVALTALLHCLVQRLLMDRYGRTMSAVKLVSDTPDAGLVAKADSTLGGARAQVVLDETRERWGDRMPGDEDRLLPWIAGLSDSDRMDLLALCIALSLNDVHEGERSGPLDPLCAMLHLDMADWWEANQATYFSRVTKDVIAKAIEEGAGAEAAARYKGISKGELARVAERDLAGHRWLPAPLKTVIEEV